MLTKKKAKQILAEVVESLNDLPDNFELESLIKHVHKARDHCLSFIEEISYQVGQLAQELPSSLPIERNEFLRLAPVSPAGWSPCASRGEKNRRRQGNV